MTPEAFQQLDLLEQARVWIETKNQSREAGKELVQGHPHPAALLVAVQHLSTSGPASHTDDTPQGDFLRSMPKTEAPKATVMFQGRPAPKATNVETGGE